MNRVKEFFTKNAWTRLYFGITKAISCDNPAVVRNFVYIVPTFSFYFNHSEWGINFYWLTLTCSIWRINFKKREEYEKKLLDMKKKQAM